MSTPAAFVHDLNHQYAALHTNHEDAFWQTYMGLADDVDAARERLQTLDIATNRFLQDPEKLTTTRAALTSAEAEGAGEDVTTALRGWVAMFEAHAIENPEARKLSEKIVEMETALAKARADMKLGYKKPDGEFVECSSVKLGMMLISEPDEALRKAAWEGLQAIESHVLANGFLDLVKARNALGRMQGGIDYYDWKVKRSEQMSKAEIFDLLDQLEELTRERGEASVAALRKEKGDNAVAPWNIRYFVTGDITKERDPYFPFSRSLERWGRSFAGLGIQYRGATMVLDLVDRKGKYENGFMHGPEIAWRESGDLHRARIHFTANAIPGMVGSGHRATNTLFHEGGHAAHFANIDMPAPCFGQEFAPTSVSFAETQSMFLDSILSDADWQTRYAKTKDGKPMPWELIEKSIRTAQPFAAHSLRTSFCVCYCERAIYEIPDDELTAERVLETVRNVEQKMTFLHPGSTRPVLSVPHLLASESSAYYHGYILALMAVHQTRNFFLKEDGYILDNPKVGPALAKTYWQPGNSRRFPEFIQSLTGEAVAPTALAEHVNRGTDDALDEARAAVAKLDQIPAFEGAVELGADIKVVHGNEEVASTADGGFDGAAATFATWIEAQE